MLIAEGLQIRIVLEFWRDFMRLRAECGLQAIPKDNQQLI
jgi:hypothetical protein